MSHLKIGGIDVEIQHGSTLHTAKVILNSQDISASNALAKAIAEKIPEMNVVAAANKGSRTELSLSLSNDCKKDALQPLHDRIYKACEELKGGHVAKLAGAGIANNSPDFFQPF